MTSSQQQTNTLAAGHGPQEADSYNITQQELLVWSSAVTFIRECLDSTKKDGKKLI